MHLAATSQHSGLDAWVLYAAATAAAAAAAAAAAHSVSVFVCTSIFGPVSTQVHNMLHAVSASMQLVSSTSTSN